DLKGFAQKLIFVVLLGFSLFQLYTGLFGEYTAYIQRTVHLGFALTAIFLLYPARKKAVSKQLKWYDYGLVIVAVAISGYWPVFYENVVQQVGSITPIQIVIGTVAILLVL